MIRRPFASQIYSYVFFRQTVKALIRLVDAHIYRSYFLCDSSSNTLLASEYEDENLTQLSNCLYKTYRFSSAFHRLPMKMKSFRYKIGVWMIPSWQNHSGTGSVLKSKVSEYLGISEHFYHYISIFESICPWMGNSLDPDLMANSKASDLGQVVQMQKLLTFFQQK